MIGNRRFVSHLFFLVLIAQAHKPLFRGLHEV